MYYIADLLVELNVSGRTQKNAEPYIYNSDKSADIIINEDYAQALVDYPHLANFKCSDEEKRSGLNYMRERDLFAKKLLNFNGIVLHCSSVVFEGKAYLFSAPSGTGKSTHTKLWLEQFCDKAYILNDDKPAIRILEDSIYAYGTPWCGSSDINTNSKAKLQGICFIKRDDNNWIKPLDSKTSTFRLLHASLINLERDDMIKEMDIIDKIINRIPIYEMGCTPTIEAAKMAYEVMSKAEVK